MKSFLRQSLIRTAAVLMSSFVGLATVGVLFESQLKAATQWCYETLGLAGLAALIVAADAATSPIPPDLTLLVIANSPLHEDWWLVVPALGALSAVSGIGGWWLGVQLGRTRLPRWLFGHRLDRPKALVARYGAVGVALGAMTPVPFSITCWIAGMLDMSRRTLAWVALLRIPRFILYYAVIAYSLSLADVLR